MRLNCKYNVNAIRIKLQILIQVNKDCETLSIGKCVNTQKRVKYFVKRKKQHFTTLVGNMQESPSNNIF